MIVAIDAGNSRIKWGLHDGTGWLNSGAVATAALLSGVVEPSDVPTVAVVSGGNAVSAGDLLSTIDSTKPPACDQAAGRFLGLSFAGWNAVSAAFAALLAGFAAFSR